MIYTPIFTLLIAREHVRTLYVVFVISMNIVTVLMLFWFNKIFEIEIQILCFIIKHAM
jgi:hypothetical protein